MRPYSIADVPPSLAAMRAQEGAEPLVPQVLGSRAGVVFSRLAEQARHDAQIRRLEMHVRRGVIHDERLALLG